MLTVPAAARVLLPAILAHALSGAGRAQERPLGPTVRALASLPAAGRVALARDTLASRLAAVTRDADGVAVAHVLVRLRNGDPGPLLRAGARLGTRSGALVNARVPLESLQALLAEGDVAAVYGARRWPPINDVGTAAIGVAGLRRRVAPDNFSGPVGRGVIVGLVDTGLDFTHPDFLVDSLGRSRVLYLWDQTLAGSGPGTVGGSSFTYGVECRQEDLSAAGCPSRETLGHGTHVLGTAAGDGSGGGQPAGQFAGVAPGADLIVVKTTFLSDAVVDGVNYIFSRAAQLGRPAVVNLSLGAQWGPHDGTLPEEEELDSLVGPGRIVVAAAGNDGDNGNTVPPVTGAVHLHASAAVPAPAALPVDFTLSVPSYSPDAGPNNDFIVLQLWYAASDTVSVTVIRPDGTSVNPGPTSTPAASVTADGPQGQIHIENGPGTSVALTADNLAFIALGDFNGGTDVMGGTWTIRVSGVHAHSGRPMHLWVADGALGVIDAFGAVSLVAGATNGYLVGSPATATRVLAVGAYVSRLQWRDVNGQARYYLNQEQLGDLAAFSSSGPRRDGVLKPDLTAPGKGVASALSHFTGVAPARIMPDGQHFVDQGTSMAAPFVTGSVGLLLERSPALTPEAARALLIGAAQMDGFAVHPFDGSPSGTPNPSWGYGKLYVPPALGSLVQLAALKAGQANDAIAGRFVPVGEFRVLHLLVIGDPDSTTVLDSLALHAAGSVNEGAVLAGLKVYRDPGTTGAVPASGVAVATAALAGDNPRVMLRVGPDTIPPRDTVALVVTTQLASGVAIPSAQTVRFDVAADTDLYFRYRSGRPLAVQGIPYRGPLVTLQAPGLLAIRALPLGGAGAPQSSARNNRFPVLRVELAATVEEPFSVQQVGVKAGGSDPAATLRVVLDLNRNGVVDDAEPVLADTTVALRGDSVLVTFAPPNLVVPAGSSVQLLMDLLTSGAAPNGARFGGAIEPSRIHTHALYSGLADHQAIQGPLSSGSVTTSLLSSGEPLNISENPVRGGSVVFNYAAAPRRIAVYTFAGDRVWEFANPPTGSVVWDLTTDAGRRVVNGVYVVTVDLGGSVIRRRLYVARKGP